jgi:hypothetical protein
MVQSIANDGIFLCGQRFKESRVGIEAAGIEDGILSGIEVAGTENSILKLGGNSKTSPAVNCRKSPSMQIGLGRDRSSAAPCLGGSRQ